MPCVAIVDGEYGYQDLAIGVPVVLGAEGMEKVIELKLTEEERRLLDESAKQVQRDLELLS